MNKILPPTGVIMSKLKLAVYIDCDGKSSFIASRTRLYEMMLMIHTFQFNRLLTNNIIYCANDIEYLIKGDSQCRTEEYRYEKIEGILFATKYFMSKRYVFIEKQFMENKITSTNLLSYFEEILRLHYAYRFKVLLTYNNQYKFSGTPVLHTLMYID